MGKPATTITRLTLGSGSPRRAHLLARLGVDFDVEVVDIDEHALIDEQQQDPRVIVETIACAKFAAFPAFATSSPDTRLLTADTLVACSGVVMGKPNTDDELAAMLRFMSGRELKIVTAVCVGPRGATPTVETVITIVELRSITGEEIHGYVATGAGVDKAGGLALQAEAKPFIQSVQGCWSNVVGLPLCAVSRLLAAASSEPPCSTELCGRR